MAAWVSSHDVAPEYVYITHPHADHFLGLPEILAAFPQARPVGATDTGHSSVVHVPALDLVVSGDVVQAPGAARVSPDSWSGWA